MFAKKAHKFDDRNFKMVKRKQNQEQENTENPPPAASGAAAKGANNNAPSQHGSPAKRGYTKKKSSPQPKTGMASPGLSNARNRISVTTTKLHSGDILMFLEKGNQPPFWVPTKQYLLNNRDFMELNLGLHMMFDKVSPSNRDGYHNVTVGNGSIARGYPLFVCIVDDDQPEMQTEAARHQLGQYFVKFFNHPDNRKGYKYFTEAVYAGDVTPTNSNPPYLSEYATNLDTMNTICRAIGGGSGAEAEPATFEYVLSQPEAMEDYFHPDHLWEAVRNFGGTGNNNNGSNNSGNNGNNSNNAPGPGPESQDLFGDLEYFALGRFPQQDNSNP